MEFDPSNANHRRWLYHSTMYFYSPEYQETIGRPLSELYRVGNGIDMPLCHAMSSMWYMKNDPELKNDDLGPKAAR